jgi:cytochrome c-type biogenesis protein
MLRDLGLAFTAGLVSCASACVLPLLPVFVAYMGGAGFRSDNTRTARLKVAGNAILFVAGFSTAFVALGAGAGLLGADLTAYRRPLILASGVALVLFGIALLGGIPWLMRERRMQVAHRLPHAPWASYLIGLAFAVGWTPCVGPILAAVLIEAANSATAASGALLLCAYSAGLGLPFVVAGLFLGLMTDIVSRVRGAYPVINTLAAVLLIGMGVLTLTNRLTALNSFVPSFGTIQVSGQLSPPRAGAGSPSALVGKHPPAITLTALDGNRLSLGALGGRPAIITFWATWCVPCKDELPVFAAAYRAHRNQELTLIAINYKESPEAVKRFWTDLALEPAPYVDPDGTAAQRFGVGLKQSGLPVTILVGRNGKVQAVFPGEISAGEFAASLNQLLASSVSSPASAVSPSP